MKYVILICDGAADYPLPELNGKTVLQAARIPNIDSFAKSGKNGLLETVPEGFAAGSDVANLSIMGYDPHIYFPGGRGVIEAASMHIDVGIHDLPMRANIITAKEGNIIDYSADAISDEESAALIASANKAFGNDHIKFYPGVSYRNLLVLKNTDLEASDLEFDAPHDHPNDPIAKHLCRGKSPRGEEWAKKLNEMMIKSLEIFNSHPINEQRKKDGRPLANMLWFWGPGKLKTKFPIIQEKFGKEGSVITGIDLIRGIGLLGGLKVIKVPGATAHYNTNFEGKADAAAKALNEGDDLVVIHVEAPDEAGHEGHIEEKVRAMENIDKRLLGRFMEKVEGEYRIGILPDHYTPISTRTHEMGAVPFIISGPGIGADAVEKFDEESAKQGAYGEKKGPEFIELLLSD